MGKTSNKVKDRYNSKAYDDIRIRVPKGCKRVLEAAASEAGESINAYVNAAILARLGLEAWEKSPED